MQKKGNIDLIFKGLDTYADIYLNDKKILTANNMFREWRIAIKSELKEGDNSLKVYFHSPIKMDIPKWDALPYQYEAGNDQSENGGVFDKKVSIFARKAGYHYGWDWGPRLVTSGIWRPVYIEACTDSIRKITNTESIRKMQSLYNYQLREKENNKLKTENAEQKLFIAYILLAFIIVIALVVIYMQHNKQIREREKEQLKKLEQIKEEQKQKTSRFIEENNMPE